MESNETERGGPASWYALGVLMLAYMVSVADRQVLSLLVTPIRADLGISDTGISLLGGIAFALFYTGMALPIAYVSDRRSRRTVIAIGIATWSAMTVLCGLARSFWQLLLARIGVGVGEAALGPAAHSLIFDLFPPHQVGRAIAIFTIGSSVGVGAALLFGAGAVKLIAEMSPTALPLVGTLRPWQLVFVLIGLPGLLVAVMAMAIREPQRIHQADTDAGEALLAYVHRHLGLYLPLFVGFSFVILVTQGALMWLPTFQLRSFGWGPATSGVVIGVAMLVAGVGGSFLGGWAADRAVARGRRDGALLVMRSATLIALPFGAATTLLADPLASSLCLAAFVFSLWVAGAVFPTTVLMTAPKSLRARLSALSFIVGNLLGMGIGPTAVALITDYGFGDPMALRFSIAFVSVLFLAAGYMLFGRARAPYLALASSEAPAASRAAPRPASRPSVTARQSPAPGR